MKKRSDRNLLRLLRQQLLVLAAEYQQAVAALPGRKMPGRGSLNYLVKVAPEDAHGA
jgi:hypothetical protein